MANPSHRAAGVKSCSTTESSLRKDLAGHTAGTKKTALQLVLGSERQLPRDEDSRSRSHQLGPGPCQGDSIPRRPRSTHPPVGPSRCGHRGLPTNAAFGSVKRQRHFASGLIDKHSIRCGKQLDHPIQGDGCHRVVNIGWIDLVEQHHGAIAIDRNAHVLEEMEVLPVIMGDLL